MEQYLSDQNQLHNFDNNNFLIIPKSIFSDNDNLPISCKNADLSAVDGGVAKTIAEKHELGNRIFQTSKRDSQRPQRFILTQPNLQTLEPDQT